MFRGVQAGRVDEKHRLCIPAKVRKSMKAEYDSTAVYITSLDGKEIKVYPVAEWEKVERKLSERSSEGGELDGARKARFLFLMTHYGAEGSLDNQGRVLIPVPLREGAGMQDDVAILWQSNHMLVLSAERYRQKTVEARLSDADLAYAENLGL